MSESSERATSIPFETVVLDEALAAAFASDEPVRYRVLDDEWNAEFTVRTIKRAEIIA